jgi:uncharacterized membrane-anchored protein YhcB (DUF1043 family)
METAVYSLNALIFTALVAFFIGALVAYGLATLISRRGGRSGDLEHRLNEAENRLSDYQDEVNDHFQQTADLVNNLTNSYREVHEHLAKGAQNLATADLSEQFLTTSAAPKLENDDILPEDAAVEPPKDWAPESGTLSESFGLNGDPKKDEDKPTTVVP